MKRAIVIAVMLVSAATAVPTAHATKASLTVVLACGSETNHISITLTPDGRSYVIDSIVPLEVGGDICWHPEGQPNQLFCDASLIGGFEVNAGAGNDFAAVAPQVRIPATLRGGPGRDRLYGGGGPDKLIGGSGDDALLGRGSNDSLFGGSGNDFLLGGSGNDLLHGNFGEDSLHGNSGRNVLVQ